ncbi:hypothetical protein KR009_010636 [Drosophila setifemur]|nr:hypothetical protein KR009_010636 [Drosophila setifemur]
MNNYSPFRTFADVHSSGLASRIVAYHDRSIGGEGGLQRSMSASNLYNPLAQPRRMPGPPLPYKATVPSLKMTQIAPPERSFYSGNTLPSLLRSNSLVGVLRKTNSSEQEHLSRENRPILHPPHPQHESEPTRSVLEELKEISRKRINSGVSFRQAQIEKRAICLGFACFQDTQPAHDFTKRSCQRVMDFVDHHHLGPIPHQQHQQQPQQSFKRQRELTVSVPLRHNHSVLAASPPTLQHMQLHTNGAISPRQSPEQLAKRRNCSYNNDIASSLSSSRRHGNKRKLFDMRESFQSTNNDSVASVSSPENSPGENVAKMPRKVDAEPISKAQSMPVPVVPAVPPPRTNSAPQTQSKDLEISHKPKLTLFNARQAVQKEREQPKDLNSPEIEAGEYACIQFVKPKQQNSALGIRNPNVERTAKTKLAIMLSGLKGELYQGEPDELDAKLPAPATTALPNPIKPTIMGPPATATSATTTKNDTKTPSKPVILSNQMIKPPQPAKTIATPTSIAGLSPSTTEKAAGAVENQPKFQLPVKPATTSAPSSSPAQPLINFASPKSTEGAAKPPMFSLGSVSNTSTTTTSPKPVFSFPGGAASGIKFGITTTTTTTATETITTNNSSGAPAIVNLAFGTGAAPTTAIVAPLTSTSSPSLGFGAAGISTSTTATISPFGAPTSATSSMLNSAKPPAPFAFGQAGEAKLGSSVSTDSGSNSGAAAAKPAVFSFGGGATPTTTGSAVAAASATPLFGTQTKPASNAFAASIPTEIAKLGGFGNQDNSFASAFKQPGAGALTANPAEPAKAAFSFNAPTTTVGTATSAATSVFAFGAGGGTTTNAKPAEPAGGSNTSSSVFGQANPSGTPFAFGGAATAGANSNTDNKSMFAFGGGDTSKPSPVFNFSGGEKSTAPASSATAATTATPANNAFGFGAAQKPTTPMFGSGSAGSQGSSAAPAAASKPFAFGGGGAQQAPAAPAAGGFSFASVANKPVEPSGANPFGSPANASKPMFNFGGGSNSQVGAGTATPASGGFSFAGAGNKKEEPAATNLFASPANANTGVVKPNFGFGGGSNSTPQAAPSFGGTTPSFGGFGSAAPNATPNQNKPFAFGASSAAPNPTPAPGGNLFANAMAAAQNQTNKPGGGFSFGGSKDTTNSATSTTGNAPFAFGGAAAGGIASPASNLSMSTAKPFSFGASTNPAPSGFGSPAPSPVPQGSNPAGAFGSPAQQANAGNLFAPPENRIMRRATRRLQK